MLLLAVIVIVGRMRKAAATAAAAVMMADGVMHGLMHERVGRRRKRQRLGADPIVQSTVLTVRIM